MNIRLRRGRQQIAKEEKQPGAQPESVREMLEFADKNKVRLEGISVKELIREGHRL